MITKEDAGKYHTFYHVTLRNADGTALRCRANGKLKIWKRNPNRWELPVKYGLRVYFCIGPRNANAWLTYDPTEWQFVIFRMVKVLKLDDTIPDEILLDLAKEKGLLPDNYVIPGTEPVKDSIHPEGF